MMHAPCSIRRNLFLDFDPNEFAYLLRKIEDKEYLAHHEIARVRKANPGIASPPELLAYERDLAAGNIKRPGRRKHDSIKDLFLRMSVLRLYHWLLDELREGKTLEELEELADWTFPQGGHWREGSLGERVVRLLREQPALRHLSEGRVRNLISDTRKRYGWWMLT